MMDYSLNQRYILAKEEEEKDIDALNCLQTVEEQRLNTDVVSTRQPAAAGLQPENRSLSVDSYFRKNRMLAMMKKQNEPVERKPKRPLTAYNIFFQRERAKILQDIPDPERKPRMSHGKIGFTELARTISKKWKGLDKEAREELLQAAAEDKQRYLREMEVWRSKTSSKVLKRVPGAAVSNETPVKVRSCKSSQRATAKKEAAAFNATPPHTPQPFGQPLLHSAPLPVKNCPFHTHRRSSSFNDATHDAIDNLVDVLDTESIEYLVGTFAPEEMTLPISSSEYHDGMGR